jgi:predicted lipoprotein with Yx(FWY)xxD motif
VIRFPRSVAASALCLAASALLTACSSASSAPAGGSAAGGGYPSGGGQMVIQMPQPITANSNDPAKSQIRAARAFDLGQMLVDGTGYTIYRYDRDSANPSRSNCNGACATEWIPVSAGGNLPPIGVDQGLVGQITRDDGTSQLTLAGWPLYHYTGDGEPAETSGQGIDQAWYPIAPDGKKITLTQDQWRQDAFGL